MCILLVGCSDYSVNIEEKENNAYLTIENKEKKVNKYLVFFKCQCCYSKYSHNSLTREAKLKEYCKDVSSDQNITVGPKQIETKRIHIYSTRCDKKRDCEIEKVVKK